MKSSFALKIIKNIMEQEYSEIGYDKFQIVLNGVTGSPIAGYVVHDGSLILITEDKLEKVPKNFFEHTEKAGKITTLADIIKMLENTDKECIVRVNADNDGAILYDICFPACINKQGTNSILFCDEENSKLALHLEYEIYEEFNPFKANDDTAIATYANMLNYGITPEIVGRYFNEEYANEMERFCNEHADKLKELLT